MDLNRLIQMIINTFMRRFVNTVVKHGFDLALGRGKSKDQMSPAERDQSKAARDMSKRVKDVAKVTRRIGLK